MANKRARKKRQALLTKGIMGRLAPLTLQQRVDYQNLVNAGVPESEARLIAQGYNGVQKAAEAPEGPTLKYLTAFHEAAKKELPEWQHDMLHKRARGRAGGHASAQASARAKLTAEDLRLEKRRELKALRKRALSLRAEIAKDGMLLSQVHVDVPMGPNKKPMASIVKNDAKVRNEINQVEGLQDPTSAPTPDAPYVAPDVLPLIQANRLVAGMDMEMAAHSLSAEDARTRASRVLLERPGHYDQVGADPELWGLRGLSLDIGSGQSREPGHLGVDLYPFDYGTCIHDVDLGLPFPDASARAVRLTNSLHPILDATGVERSPVPLLTEIQRVLMEGGQLHYEGPEPLFEQGQNWPLPGLALIGQDEAGPLRAPVMLGAPVKQIFRRVPLLVPAYPGADARYAPADPMPLDVALALLAQNSSPAAIAMANLVHKSQTPERVVPIVKADTAKRICYGEVLNPLTLDSQNDWLTAADIEKAAHDYMMTSRVIGSEHGAPIDAGVVESFVAPQDLHFDGPSGPVDVPKGTWLIGVKLRDDAEWAKVLDGTYTGFSIGGFGVRDAGEPLLAANS